MKVGVCVFVLLWLLSGALDCICAHSMYGYALVNTCVCVLIEAVSYILFSDS